MAVPAKSSIVYHDLDALIWYESGIEVGGNFVLDVADCLRASRTSDSRSLGNARETLSRCKQETAVDVNFAF